MSHSTLVIFCNMSHLRYSFHSFFIAIIQPFKGALNTIKKWWSKLYHFYEMETCPCRGLRALPSQRSLRSQCSPGRDCARQRPSVRRLTRIRGSAPNPALAVRQRDRELPCPLRESVTLPFRQGTGSIFFLRSKISTL